MVHHGNRNPLVLVNKHDKLHRTFHVHSQDHYHDMLFVRTRIQSCEQYVSPWQQCMILKMISQMERSTMERPHGGGTAYIITVPLYQVSL